MKRIAYAAIIGLIVVAGCGDDDTAEAPITTSAEDPSTTVEPVTTTTAPACDRPAAPGSSERTITVDGLERSYILHVPASYDGSSTALMVNMHGSGYDGQEQIDGSGLNEVADAEGFVTASPDAGVSHTFGEEGPTGGAWTVPGVPYVDGTEVDEDAPDDVHFLEVLVDEVSAELCIDTVVATGISGGGRMASALACFSDKFDVIAPVAGLRVSEDCAPKRSVDIVAFHGTEDKVNPYAGGGPASWGPTSVPDAAAQWAELQGCADGPVRTEVSPSVQLDIWSACRDGVEVQLYTVQGGGHNWPGGPDAATRHPELAAFLGVTTQEINAGALIWERVATRP